MRKSRKLFKSLQLALKRNILPFSAGLLIFLCLGGIHTLLPSNINWIFGGLRDPQQSYLGWVFFRNTPFFQFPLGANPELGMDISSSIVFTDSIPILAITFKCFSFLLGDVFQYLGLWLGLCYSLQYLLAYKLIKSFGCNNLHAAIGALFIVLSPVFLTRTTIHLALSAHWLILAALYIFFQEHFSSTRWTLLLLLAVAIHAYLFIMVGAVWGCDIIQRLIRREIRIKTAFFNLAAGVLSSFLLMWVLGYFMLGMNPRAELTNGMNLLSLVNPGINAINGTVEFSKILPGIKVVQGDGFMFLGIGNLLLLFLSACISFKNRLRMPNPTNKYGLIIIVVVMSAIALSNKIYFGEHELFHYPLLKPLDYFYSVFRGYGRMFFPVYYLIILISVVVLSTIRKRYSLPILLILISLHIYDMSNSIAGIRKFYSNSTPWQTPLKSNLWSALARGRDKVLYVLPDNIPFGFLPWVDYAARNSMAINMGYFSRASEAKIRSARSVLTKTLLDGRIDPSAIYVFKNEKLWDVLRTKLQDDDLAVELDGFKVLAPLSRGIVSQGCSEIEAPALRPDYFDLLSGPICFKHGCKGARYLIAGWSGPEPWGTWSNGPEALVYFTVQTIPAQGLILRISSTAFVTKKHPSQRADVYINDQYLETIKKHAAEETIDTLIVPASMIDKNNGQLRIKFHFPDAVSPASLDISSDKRALAFGLTMISIE